MPGHITGRAGALYLRPALGYKVPGQKQGQVCLALGVRDTPFVYLRPSFCLMADTTVSLDVALTSNSMPSFR